MNDDGRDSVMSGSDQQGSGAHANGGHKRKVPKVFSKEAITKFRAWLFQNLTVRPVSSSRRYAQLSSDFPPRLLFPLLPPSTTLSFLSVSSSTVSNDSNDFLYLRRVIILLFYYILLIARYGKTVCDRARVGKSAQFRVFCDSFDLVRCAIASDSLQRRDL